MAKFAVLVHKQPEEKSGAGVWSSLGSDFYGPIDEPALRSWIEQMRANMKPDSTMDLLILEADLIKLR